MSEFEGWEGPRTQSASPCQISWRSVKLFLGYGDFSISLIWRLKWLPNECRKLQGWWTKVHQIFTQCREDVSGVNASIRFAILPSVVECEFQEWRRVADFGRYLPIWRLKLVAMAMSRSRNEYQTEHLYEHVYKLCKFGKFRSGRFWDLCSKRSLRKKDKRERK